MKSSQFFFPYLLLFSFFLIIQCNSKTNKNKDIQLLNPIVSYISPISEWKFQIFGYETTNAIETIKVHSIQFILSNNNNKKKNQNQKDENITYPHELTMDQKNNNIYTLHYDTKIIKFPSMIRFKIEIIDKKMKKNSYTLYSKVVVNVPWKKLLVEIFDDEKLNPFQTVQNGKKLSATKDEALMLQFNWPYDNIPTPQQCILELRPVGDNNTKTSFIWTIPNKSKNPKHFILSLDLGENGKKMKYRSDNYEITLYISHVVYKNSLQWNLGQVYIGLDKKPLPVHYPLYARTLLHESDTTLHALPEITHITRESSKEPIRIIPYSFSLLTVVLTFFWIKTIIQNGWFNLEYWPKSTVESFIHLLFFTGILSIFILFVFYWIKLRIFTALNYLLFLGIFTIFTGKKALKNLLEIKERKMKTA